MFEICDLNLYPVKSLKGIAVHDSPLTLSGLTFDREWMLTDTNGKFLTQRQITKMATISVRLTSEHLILEHPNHISLKVALTLPKTEPQKVTVWQDRCLGYDEGEEASEWLTSVLGKWQEANIKLVRFCQKQTRYVKPRYLQGETSYTAFADGFPFLITSQASLDHLNTQLEANGASSIPMNRFRPNIVIRGLEPFAEDRIDTLTATDKSYSFALRKPCERCSITTTDQLTGERAEPKEPLRTLIKMKTQPTLKGAYFGQNAILLSGDGQTITVGDRLSAYELL